jgi:hypothetical protein
MFLYLFLHDSVARYHGWMSGRFQMYFNVFTNSHSLVALQGGQWAVVLVVVGRSVVLGEHM